METRFNNWRNVSVNKCFFSRKKNCFIAKNRISSLSGGILECYHSLPLEGSEDTTELNLCTACMPAYLFIFLCYRTGQKRTKLPQVPTSVSTATVWSEFRTTRCWSAPAGCRSTSSPLTFRFATSPSSLSYILVSLRTYKVSTFQTLIWDPDRTTTHSGPVLWFPLITVNEIQLVHSPSSSRTSDMTMRTQYEWLFVSMTVSNKTVDMFNLKQDMLIYSVSMYEDSPTPGANSFSNTRLYDLTDHHEEAVSPLHCQLPAAHPVPPESGYRILLYLRKRGREARLQGYRAARRHPDAASSEWNPALVIRSDSTHR